VTDVCGAVRHAGRSRSIPVGYPGRRMIENDCNPAARQAGYPVGEEHDPDPPALEQGAGRDLSCVRSPRRSRARSMPILQCIGRAVGAHRERQADRAIGESISGGGSLEALLRTVDGSIAYKIGTASRGKAIRAEPVSAFASRAASTASASSPSSKTSSARGPPPPRGRRTASTRACGRSPRCAACPQAAAPPHTES